MDTSPSSAGVTPAELRVLARALAGDDKLLYALVVFAAQISDSPGAGALTAALDDADVGRMARLATVHPIAERTFMRCLSMSAWRGGGGEGDGGARPSDYAWHVDMGAFEVFNVAHADALNLLPYERKRVETVVLNSADALQVYATTAPTPDQVRAFFSVRPLLHRMRVLVLPPDAALAEALLDVVLETPSHLVALQMIVCDTQLSHAALQRLADALAKLPFLSRSTTSSTEPTKWVEPLSRALTDAGMAHGLARGPAVGVYHVVGNPRQRQWSRLVRLVDHDAEPSSRTRVAVMRDSVPVPVPMPVPDVPSFADALPVFVSSFAIA
jgi:hypothetical protein